MVAAQLALGRRPDPLSVAFTTGAAFTATLRSQDATGAPSSWPEGATLRLAITGQDGYVRSWPWTIIGEQASLTIPATEVDELPDTGLRAQLWLNYGDGDFLWAAGMVVRYA